MNINNSNINRYDNNHDTNHNKNNSNKNNNRNINPNVIYEKRFMLLAMHIIRTTIIKDLLTVQQKGTNTDRKSMIVTSTTISDVVSVLYKHI